MLRTITSSAPSRSASTSSATAAGARALHTSVPRRTASPQQHRAHESSLSASSASASPRPDTSVSTRLWADALTEEHDTHAHTPTAHAIRRDPPPPPPQYPNWTGDESVQDAVLRMLVDKYKPLRAASIRTAEEKLKSAPPGLGLGVHTAPTMTPESASTSTSTPEVQDTTEHKPWLTTFRAPSHATSIRYMRLPPLPATGTPRGNSNNAPGPNPAIHPDDTRTRILEREKKKKAAYAGRITNAREASLDYRIGKYGQASSARDAGVHRAPAMPNPVSIKGWTSLVEERIERARSEGLFRSLKGRGKPLARDHEQGNPFIPREEFLMNRIVQRQGAAPPWVELQGELDAAIEAFRGTLQAAWTRRAVRALRGVHAGAGGMGVGVDGDVGGPRMLMLTRDLRDGAWEAREAAYHEAAIREINEVVRRYNGVAPYAVRRAYLTREGELERMYEVCVGGILDELRGGAGGGGGRALDVGGGGGGVGEAGQDGGGDGNDSKTAIGLGAMWRRWVAWVMGG